MNSAICLLEAAAEKFGGRTAVSDENGSVTYSEYRETARKIATWMLKNDENHFGIRPVVVYLPKSISALETFMGTLYFGGAYVPVDIHVPMPRLSKICASVCPAFVVTDAEHESNLDECDLNGATVCLFEDISKENADDALVEASVSKVVDTDPIYIMYTSGSTGVPKGVTIPHRGIIDYSEWVVTTFGYGENAVMANQAPFYFDNSTYDIYGCMRSGAKLILIPDALMMFPLKLPEFLADNGVTSIFWVPTVMINVANSGALEGVSLPKLKNVAFCGEVMPNKQLNIWRRALPNCSYANLYGPTEITDVCCYYKIDREFADNDMLPIGRACENMRAVILSEKGELCAVGETGELCIIGSGVALGYYNAPEITAKVFVHNPLTGGFGERMYRTGDLAYVNDEGLIMFLGRRDSQIKLRGNRIELGEIENAAVCVQGVSNACAVFDAEEQEIVLFVEAKGETLPHRRFNMELKKFIPQYMLPAKMVVMENLPHTANDKIDRVKLKASLRESV